MHYSQNLPLSNEDVNSWYSWCMLVRCQVLVLSAVQILRFSYIGIFAWSKLFGYSFTNTCENSDAKDIDCKR